MVAPPVASVAKNPLRIDDGHRVTIGQPGQGANLALQLQRLQAGPVQLEDWTYAALGKNLPAPIPSRVEHRQRD